MSEFINRISSYFSDGVRAAETTDGAALLVALVGLAYLAILFAALFMAVATMMLFRKGGRSPLWAFVPIADLYIMFKLIWNETAFLVYLVLSVVGSSVLSFVVLITAALFSPIVTDIAIAIYALVYSVMYLILSVRLAKAYGKSAGYGILIFLFPIIFYPALAFGKSEYVG